MTNYRVFCLSETLSPLTHMRGVSGNEALIQREPTNVDQWGVVSVPVISANAIRHRMIREPGAQWLVETYGLVGTLSLSQLNLLFHGGSLTQSAGGREDSTMLVTVRRLWPLLRVMGCSLPSRILPGMLSADRGTLVCRENAERIRALSPDGWGFDSDELPPAETWVSGYQYTRGDASKLRGDMSTNAEADSALMIYGGEAVSAGAMFVHGFRLHRADVVELGCLLYSLKLWADSGATIGGQSSKGHGQLRMQYAVLGDEPIDSGAAIAAYIEHCMSVQSEAVGWLLAMSEKKKVE